MTSHKFKIVSFNNRKKQLTVAYTSGKKMILHYSSLGIYANIQKVWIDPETKGQSVGIELSNGKIDYMPYDQPLAIVKDSDYLLQTQMELLIADIKEAIQQKKISKRYLAEQLHTSDNQIQRLLNPAILNKNLKQLYQLATLLNLELKINTEKAAQR